MHILMIYLWYCSKLASHILFHLEKLENIQQAYLGNLSLECVHDEQIALYMDGPRKELLAKN